MTERCHARARLLGEFVDTGWFGVALGLTLAKLAAFLALMLLVSQRVIPFILHYVAHTGSRELFRLAVLVPLALRFGSALVNRVA